MHPIKSVDEFIAYFIENYETKQSLFHWVDELDSLQKSPNESIRQFAARVQQKSFDIETVIVAKLGNAMTTHNVFDFMSGMVVRCRHLTWTPYSLGTLLDYNRKFNVFATAPTKRGEELVCASVDFI